MSFIKKVGKFAFDFIPINNEVLYKISQRYVDRYKGENNSDPSNNGEEHLLRAVLPMLQGGVVFDVGANIGDWAKYALSVEPSIQLHCFEPSHATFHQLAKQQWPSNVFLNNFGFGDADGQLELNIMGSSSGLNSLYIRGGVQNAKAIAKEVVSIKTVDAYCKENEIDNIDFFKVDVEGHELAVFRGMSQMLKERRIRMIQFEYGGCNLDARVYLYDIWSFLAPFGFRFLKLYPYEAREITAYSQALETFKYSNYVAKLA